MGVKYDEKSCGVVLVTAQEPRQFLLLHYPNGHWDLAKGHVEEGEDEKETARRELEEETGIKEINFVSGFREEISYKYYRQGRLSNKQVVFFLATTPEKQIKLSHEHQDHLWLPFEDALEKLSFDNARNLLKKAQKFL